MGAGTQYTGRREINAQDDLHIFSQSPYFFSLRDYCCHPKGTRSEQPPNNEKTSSIFESRFQADKSNRFSLFLLCSMILSLQIYTSAELFFPSFQVIMYILLPQQTMTFRTWQSICIFLCSNFFTACCHLPKKLHRFIMSVSLEIHFPWPSSFMQGKKVKYSGA